MHGRSLLLARVAWVVVAGTALAIANIAELSTDILFPDLYSLSPFLEVASQWVFMGFVVSLLWSQVYRYRRVSTPAQRLQTRWVVFGTTLAIAGTFPFRAPLDSYLVDGDTPFVLLVLEAGFTLSFLLLPFSIGVAMLRSRLFDPLRRRIQSFIDRRFYRKKYDARVTIERFSAKLRDETDLDALSEELVAAVRETVQPAHISLWLQPRAGSNRIMKEWAG
jgi:hypothetical protein